MEIQQNELSKGVAINRRGLHFCLIVQVPFSRPRTIFFVVKRTLSLPVCLPLNQFYFQIIMHFFVFRKKHSKIYCYWWRSKIKLCCTFQLKSHEHNNTILQVFPIKIEKLISTRVRIRVGSWKLSQLGRGTVIWDQREPA